MISSVARRLETKYERDESGCWLWTGAIDRNGYGCLSVKIDGRWRTRKAHRLSYELYVGPIPGGLGIDHLCRVRNCVNPEHLEPVTQAVNNGRRPDKHVAPSDDELRTAIANFQLSHDRLPTLRELGLALGRRTSDASIRQWVADLPEFSASARALDCFAPMVQSRPYRGPTPVHAVVGGHAACWASARCDATVAGPLVQWSSDRLCRRPACVDVERVIRARTTTPEQSNG